MIRRPSRAAQVSMSRKVLLASAGLVAAGAVALSGCQTQSPIQTQFAYQPADGVAVSLGTVQVRDLVVVSSAQDQPGVLSGVVVNKGGQPVRVSFATADGGQTSVDAAPGQITRLEDGTTADPAMLPKVATAPGGLLQVEVSTPEGGAQNVKVPVLLPQGYYQTITPPATSGATSTPAPSATDTLPVPSPS
ncbi:hypothetical protein, partial [Oryzihumus leptocrescens]